MAELFAIHKAVEYIIKNGGNDLYSIIIDSKSY